MENYRDKARGMFIGLAVGDALGAPVEFGYSSDMIRHLGKSLEHFKNTPRSNKGEWTDDTSMALCLADSLLEKEGYNSYDIMEKYANWLEDGYRTPDKKPAADVGYQTKKAIIEYELYQTIPKYTPKTELAGNGPIMRLAPIIIANTFPNKKYKTLKQAYSEGKLIEKPEDGEYIESKEIEPTIKMAELSCRETHNNVAACATTSLFATTLYCALHGLKKNHIVTYCSRWIKNEEYDQFWLENFEKLVGRALEKNDEHLRDLGGYIVDTFAISLWGLIQFDTFEKGMMAVLRLGGDTDTNCACYGQLAGAYYGYEKIPEKWRENVYLAKEIIDLSDRLLNIKKCPILKTRFEDDEHFTT